MAIGFFEGFLVLKVCTNSSQLFVSSDGLTNTHIIWYRVAKNQRAT
jgi:hypothetical protein